MQWILIIGTSTLKYVRTYLWYHWQLSTIRATLWSYPTNCKTDCITFEVKQKAIATKATRTRGHGKKQSDNSKKIRMKTKQQTRGARPIVRICVHAKKRGGRSVIAKRNKLEKRGKEPLQTQSGREWTGWGIHVSIYVLYISIRKLDGGAENYIVRDVFREVYWPTYCFF